jgi:WD40 repeat protein
MLRPRVCFCVTCPLLGLLALLLVLLRMPAGAAGAAEPGRVPVSFINDVAPILKENCFACHDSKKRKGKLDMTTYAGLRKGGSKDDPIEAGKPRESLIIDLLTTRKAGRMPPKEAGEPLPAERVALIARWIEAGARLDAGIAPGADLMRELRVRWKPPLPPAAYTYPASINALAFTPDGKKIVAGGQHELTVWDVASGKLEKRIRTRSERAHSMLFLPDGKLAVAGGRPGQEGDVRVYDIGAAGAQQLDGVPLLDGVENGQVLSAALLDTDDEVWTLALSKDGKRLAAGGCDRLIRVWDIAAGVAAAKLEQTIENHADWVFGLAFTPDGKQLLSASRDKTAKAWDLVAKEPVLTFPDHQNGVYAVAITADGKTGISAGEDNTLRLWHTTDAAKQLGKQLRFRRGHDKTIFRIALAENAKKPVLATCSADGTVRLWNLGDLTVTKTLTGLSDWVFGLALSPDGTLVAGGSYNGEVRIWKTADGSVVRAFNASPGYTAPTAVSATQKK